MQKKSCNLLLVFRVSPCVCVPVHSIVFCAQISILQWVNKIILSLCLGERNWCAIWWKGCFGNFRLKCIVKSFKIGPLQLSYHVTYFSQIMGYNLKYLEWKKPVENITTAKFEAPGTKEWDFWQFDFFFWKNLRFEWKSCWRIRPCSPTTFSTDEL